MNTSKLGTWIRIAAAAKLRGVSRQTIYSWVERGVIRHKREYDLELVHRTDVEAAPLSGRSEAQKKVRAAKKEKEKSTE